jgi:K+-sensing histidine kinase KdpD
VISIRTFRDQESTVLEVCDNGLGIDMNRYGHQLFRMRKTFHSHPDARCVGLFISKNQVETMGGEIRAHGKEGVGMTFIVKFKKDL